jgi:NAD+ kinase
MNRRPQRFLVLGNGSKPQVPVEAALVRQTLEQAGGIVEQFDLSGETSVVGHAADMAVVLGGDGSILRAAHQMGADQVPVVGINLGRLGFLAEIGPNEWSQVLPRVLVGEYRLSRHLLMTCEVHVDGRSTSFFVLNEIVISAGPPFQITNIDLTVDGESVATFNGDGLIVSTPIGSTAHNLAAGGPILQQELPAVAITPICPHALTFRPLVESADSEFVLKCSNASEGTTLIIDGFLQLPMKSIEKVTLRRAPVDFQLARMPGRGYYRTLTEKLQWGSDQRVR